MINPRSIGVVVVVKNGERYLDGALKSVFAQDFPPAEVVVVDGNSADRTASIARGYPLTEYLRQMSGRLAEARNMGLDALKSEWVSFLDHDDWWAPGKLRRQVEELDRRPGLDGVIGRLEFVVEEGADGRPGFDAAAYARPRPAYTPGALLVRRKAFDRVGRFNPDFLIGCDSEWFARGLRAGLKLAVPEDVVLYKRVHASNLSADSAEYSKELLAIVRESLKQRARPVSESKNASGRNPEAGDGPDAT